MVHIRAATSNDIDDIARLLSVIRMKEILPADIQATLEQIMSYEYADVLLVENDDNTVVGMGVLNCILKLNRIECRLDEILIDPTYRGYGLGSMLMEACDEWAWNKGCYKIEFTSRGERSDAQKFYAKHGYEKRDSNIYTKFSKEVEYVKTKII